MCYAGSITSKKTGGFNCCHSCSNHWVKGLNMQSEAEFGCFSIYFDLLTLRMNRNLDVRRLSMSSISKLRSMLPAHVCFRAQKEITIVPLCPRNVFPWGESCLLEYLKIVKPLSVDIYHFLVDVHLQTAAIYQNRQGRGSKAWSQGRRTAEQEMENKCVTEDSVKPRVLQDTCQWIICMRDEPSAITALELLFIAPECKDASHWLNLKSAGSRQQYYSTSVWISKHLPVWWRGTPLRANNVSEGGVVIVDMLKCIPEN